MLALNLLLRLQDHLFSFCLKSQTNVWVFAILLKTQMLQRKFTTNNLVARSKKSPIYALWELVIKPNSLSKEIRRE